MASTQQELRRIEKATVRLRNKIKRADLDYTVQVSIASTDPTVLRYAAQLTPPAQGLAPITLVALSADELVEKIKATAKYVNYDEVEVAYHESQIEACERTILGHKERIAELKTPEKTEEAEQETTEEGNEGEETNSNTEK